jgi:hypothetical protein
MRRPRSRITAAIADGDGCPDSHAGASYGREKSNWCAAIPPDANSVAGIGQ